MSTNRRLFIKQSLLATGGLIAAHGLSALPGSALLFPQEAFSFHISLAQWSLHKTLFDKTITTLDFPEVAKKKYGIDTVEYVNQFFLDKMTDLTYFRELKKRCEDNGVKSNLIMIDQAGSLASPDKKERNTAIDTHLHWMDAALELGCKSIRVNLHGQGTEQEWKAASIESLNELAVHASQLELNVLVENHGGFSSSAPLLVDVIHTVNRKSCGTLPDFGNFCIRREKAGDLWESPCVEAYDKYLGVEELLPYAGGVSAKTFDFDAAGNETTIDYKKMFTLIKQAGFQGIVGIEYEGSRLSEEEGIKATKKLLERVREELK